MSKIKIGLNTKEWTIILNQLKNEYFSTVHNLPESDIWIFENEKTWSRFLYWIENEKNIRIVRGEALWEYFEIEEADMTFYMLTGDHT